MTWKPVSDAAKQALLEAARKTIQKQGNDK